MNRLRNLPRFQALVIGLLLGHMALPPSLVFANPPLQVAPGQQTKISQTNNSVPVVDIAYPNAQGLSHNKFLQYNVGEQGLILNNANTQFGVTALGGVTMGNPNLQFGNSASVILNEVTSTNPSDLRGWTEVNGQRAAVILSNPNGISVNGAGFLNANRVTLTTGNPIITNGRVSGFLVNKGKIHIQDGGVDARNADAFDIISRSAEIAGAVAGNEINVIAGRNEVDYVTNKVTYRGPDGDEPAVAIDSSALGGMYGKKIKVIATDKGVGVNMRGTNSASAGGLFAKAAGKLRVNRVRATKKVTLQSTESAVETEGSVHAGELLEIQAKTNVKVGNGSIASGQQGTSIQADGNVSVESNAAVGAGTNELGQFAGAAASANIQAGGTVENQGTIATSQNLAVVSAGTINWGRMSAAQDANLQAPSIQLNDQSSLEAGRDLALNTATLNSAGEIRVGRNAALTTATSTFATTASTQVQGNLQAQASSAFTANSETLVGQNFTLTAPTATFGAFSSTETIGNFAVTASNRLDANGEIRTGGATTISAPTFSQLAGGELLSAGAITLSNSLDSLIAGNVATDGAFTWTNPAKKTITGSLGSQGNLTLSGGAIDVGSTATVQSGSVVNLDSGNNALTFAGELLSVGDVIINANSADFSGTGTLAQGLTWNTAQASTISGDLTVQEDASFTALAGLQATSGSELAVGKSLTIDTASSASSLLGQTYATDAISITSSAFTQGGAMQSDGTLAVTTAGTQQIDGAVASRQGLTLTNSGLVVSSTGKVQSASTTDLLSGSGNVQFDGLLTSFGNATVSSANATFGNTSEINTDQDLTFQQLATLTLGSKGEVRGNLAANNLGTTLTSTADLGVAGTVSLDSGAGNTLVDGSLLSLGDLSVTSQDLTIGTTGSLATESLLTLTQAGAVASSGSLLSGGALTVDAASASFAAGSKTLSDDSLTVDTAGSALTINGSLGAQKDLSVISSDLTLGNGSKVESGQLLTLTQTGLLDSDGRIAGQTGINASNIGTTLRAASQSVTDGDFTLNTGAGSTSFAGLLSSQGLLDWDTASFSSLATGNAAAKQIDLDVVGTFTNAGNLMAVEDLRLNHSGLHTNSGSLQAGTVLDIETDGALINSGNWEAGTQLDVTGTALTNNAGALIFSDGTATFSPFVGDLINNGVIDVADALNLQARGINQNGILNVGKALDLTSTSLGITFGNGSQTLAGENLTATSAAGLVQSGAVQSLGQLHLEAPGNLAVNGLTRGNTGISLKTNGDFTHTSGISTPGTFTLQARNFTNNNFLAAGGDLTTKLTGSLTNNNTLLSLGNSQYQVNGNLINTGAILGNGNITVENQAGGASNLFSNRQNAVLESWGGNISLFANTIENLGTAPVIQRDQPVSTGTYGTTVVEDKLVSGPTGSAKIRSAGSITLQGGNITNSYGLISAGTNLHIPGAYSLTNIGAQLNRTTTEIEGGPFFLAWHWGTREPKFKGHGFSNIPDFVIERHGGTIRAIQPPSVITFWRGRPLNYTPAVEPTEISAEFLEPYHLYSPVLETVKDQFASHSPQGGGGKPTFEYHFYERQNPVTKVTAEQIGVAAGTIEARGSITGTISGPFSNTNTGITFNQLNPTFINAAGPNTTRTLRDIGGTSATGLVLGDALTGLGGLGQAFTPTDIGNSLYTLNSNLFDANQFTGSDYFLDLAGVDPLNIRRLGDAFFETNYVSEQLFRLLGRRFVSDDFANESDQLKSLFDNAQAERLRLGLIFGNSLSAEQIRDLDQDIVWLERREVNGETVFEPVVYLTAETLTSRAANGASMFASAFDLQVGSLENSGSLRATDSFLLNSDGDIRNRGWIDGGDTLTLTAAQSFINEQGGALSADGLATIEAELDVTFELTKMRLEGDFNINAGRDITFDIGEVFERTATTTKLSQIGSDIEIGGEFTAFANRDLTIIGADLAVGGTATFTGLNELNILSGESVWTTKDLSNPNDRIDDLYTQLTTPTIEAGALNLNAGEAMTLVGANIDVEGAANLTSQGTLDILAGEERTSHDSFRKSGKKGFFKSESTEAIIRDTTTAISSRISADTLTIKSEGDLTIKGSELNSENLGTIFTRGDLLIDTAENTESFYKKSTKSSGLFSETETQERDSLFNTASVVESQLGNLDIEAVGDLTLRGSIAQAANDVEFTSGGDMSFVTALDTLSTRYELQSNGWGTSGSASASGVEGRVGYHDNYKLETSEQSGLLGSGAFAGNNLTLNIGGDGLFEAASLFAEENLVIDAEGKIDFLASWENTHDHYEEDNFTVYLSAQANSGIVGAAMQLKSAAELLGDGGGEAGAMGLVAGGLRAVNGVGRIGSIIDNPMAAANVVNVSVSIGYESMEAESDDYSEVARTTALGAKNISISAGDDITFQGTQLEAQDGITIETDGQVILEQALSRWWGASERESHGASIGIGFAAGATQAGAGITVGGHYSKEESSYDKGTYLNTEFMVEPSKLSISARQGIIDRQTGIDWDRQESSSFGTGQLSFDIGAIKNGEASFQNPFKGNQVTTDGQGLFGTLSAPFDFVERAFGSLGGNTGGWLGNAISVGGESFYASALNTLLYGDSAAIDDVWARAGLSGASAVGANIVAHGPIDWTKNPAEERLLKPILHGLTQGAAAELFGNEFADGFVGATIGSYGAVLAEQVGFGLNMKPDQVRELQRQLSQNAGQASVGLFGGDTDLGRIVSENVWEYNHDYTQIHQVIQALEGVKNQEISNEQFYDVIATYHAEQLLDQTVGLYWNPFVSLRWATSDGNKYVLQQTLKTDVAALLSILVVEGAITSLPAVGESMDAAELIAPDSTKMDRAIAGTSLIVGIFGPSVSRWIKGGDHAFEQLEAVDELIDGIATSGRNRQDVRSFTIETQNGDATVKVDQNTGHTTVFNADGKILGSTNPATNPEIAPLNDDIPLLLSVTPGNPRYLPGTASNGPGLPRISEGEQWLRGSDGNAGRVPAQIAEKLQGRTFRDFDEFRSAFWIEVSLDPILSPQFSVGNRALMARGNAPVAVKGQQVGGRFVYEIDHVKEIQDGGNVYDMNNLIIRTPLNHIRGKY